MRARVGSAGWSFPPARPRRAVGFGRADNRTDAPDRSDERAKKGKKKKRGGDLMLVSKFITKPYLRCKRKSEIVQAFCSFPGIRDGFRSRAAGTTRTASRRMIFDRREFKKPARDRRIPRAEAGVGEGRRGRGGKDHVAIKIVAKSRTDFATQCSAKILIMIMTTAGLFISKRKRKRDVSASRYRFKN